MTADDPTQTSAGASHGSTTGETGREVQPAPSAGASVTAPARATAAGRVWVAIAIAVIVLALLIIFIAENSRDVTISFLGAKGTLSLGLALLIAAVAGVVITLLAGTARILQLRREVRRRGRRAARAAR